MINPQSCAELGSTFSDETSVLYPENKKTKSESINASTLIQKG